MIGFRKISQSITLNDVPHGETGFIANCTNGDVYVTLPTANLANREGAIIYLCKEDATLNYVWVQRDDGEDFNTEVATLKQNYAYDTVVLTVVDGEWFIAWAAAWV